jgi:hypothetical protein
MRGLDEGSPEIVPEGPLFHFGKISAGTTSVDLQFRVELPLEVANAYHARLRIHSRKRSLCESAVPSARVNSE